MRHAPLLIRGKIMDSMGAKLVTGGIVTILGLVMLKFVFGVLGFVFFLAIKVIPLVLIGMLVVWIFRRLTRQSSSSSTT
jgi:hypothetical protein